MLRAVGEGAVMSRAKTGSDWVAGANSSLFEQAQSLAGDRCHGREGLAVDFVGNNFI